MALALCIALVACGGGGGGSSSDGADGGGSGADGDFGVAVALQLQPPLPALVGTNSTTSASVLAVDAKGATRDVTALAKLTINAPERLAATVSDGRLQVRFLDRPGSVGVRIEALGLSLDAEFWSSSVVPPNRKLDRIKLRVGEGFSPVVPNPDGSVSLLPERVLLIQAQALFEGGAADITNGAQLGSTATSVLAVQPMVATDGDIRWWTGVTLAPGTSTLQVRWAGLRAGTVVNVSTGFILRAPVAEQSDITENAAGRTTAYMQIGNDLTTWRLAYVESYGGDRWSEPVVLPSPASLSPIVAGSQAAESPNGYRATYSQNSLGDGWVYLIGPDGQVKGPVVVTDRTRHLGFRRIAVSSDGAAHVFLMEQGVVIRRLVRFSDASARTVWTVPLDLSESERGPRVAVGSDGTVGIAWIDKSCNVHYAFESLSNLAPGAPDTIGSARVSSCNQMDFGSILTDFDLAADANALAVLITYPASVGVDATELLTVRRGTAATMTPLSRDGLARPGSQRIGMSSSGEFVAIWPMRDGGVSGVYGESVSTGPGLPFVVEAPFFSLGTPDVHSVVPRGDGRFLLVWPAGASVGRTSLEMREFSKAAGLGPLIAFPFQSSTSTSSTKRLATPFGISALWDDAIDADSDEVVAMQWLVP